MEKNIDFSKLCFTDKETKEILKELKESDRLVEKWKAGITFPKSSVVRKESVEYPKNSGLFYTQILTYTFNEVTGYWDKLVEYFDGAKLVWFMNFANRNAPLLGFQDNAPLLVNFHKSLMEGE